MPAPHYKLTQPVIHVVWHIGGQGDMGQICPALHAALSPHGMGSPISSIAGPQLRSGVLWLYATTQNGPAHHGNGVCSKTASTHYQSAKHCRSLPTSSERMRPDLAATSKRKRNVVVAKAALRLSHGACKEINGQTNAAFTLTTSHMSALRSWSRDCMHKRAELA